MPVRRCIVIVIATGFGSKRSERSVASSRVVQIMPTTSEHCMDEQRYAQQATKNGTH
jgi:hypothetical protein